MILEEKGKIQALCPICGVEGMHELRSFWMNLSSNMSRTTTTRELKNIPVCDKCYGEINHIENIRLTCNISAIASFIILAIASLSQKNISSLWVFLFLACFLLNAIVHIATAKTVSKKSDLIKRWYYDKFNGQHFL